MTTPTQKPEKAISSKAFAMAKGLIGRAEVLDGYVHNKHLVLQLATCTFRIKNN
jgi:hypothetical protein